MVLASPFPLGVMMRIHMGLDSCIGLLLIGILGNDFLYMIVIFSIDNLEFLLSKTKFTIGPLDIIKNLRIRPLDSNTGLTWTMAIC